MKRSRKRRIEKRRVFLRGAGVFTGSSAGASSGSGVAFVSGTDTISSMSPGSGSVQHERAERSEASRLRARLFRARLPQLVMALGIVFAVDDSFARGARSATVALDLPEPYL